MIAKRCTVVKTQKINQQKKTKEKNKKQKLRVDECETKSNETETTMMVHFGDKAETYLFEDLMLFTVFKNLHENDTKPKEFVLQRHSNFGHKELQTLIELKNNKNKNVFLKDFNEANDFYK